MLIFANILRKNKTNLRFKYIKKITKNTQNEWSE